MRFIKKESVFGIVRLAFLLFVILYSLIRQNITAIQPFLDHESLNIFLTCFAALIVFWDILVFKNIFKMKYIWLLVAFWGFTLVSVFLNTEFGFVDNLKTVINLFIQFFAVYVVISDYKREELIRELKIICNTLCAVWCVAAIVSVYMYFADIFYYQTRYLWGNQVDIVQGFVREHGGAIVMRLWGIFVDPNFASGISIAVICLGLFVIYNSKCKAIKAFHIVNILFQFLYIVLSNSRMSYIILYLISAVGGCYFSWPLVNKLLHRRAAKASVALILTIASFFAGYICVQTTKTVLPYIKYPISNFGDSAVTPDPGTTDTKVPGNIESLDRLDIIAKDDVSNGRFDLWMDGMQVFLSKPVFGVGPRNYHSAAVQIIPDTLIAGGYSVHNSYIELLMGNGIVGFVVLLIFFLLCAKDVVFLHVKQVSFRSEGLLMLAVLSLLASGMFIACLFYTLSGATIILFAILGYAVRLMND